MAEWYKIT
ncbi:hypothetical protein S40288_09322 [Stachybotrys chartarum IBT 40288]|nr:hypothetical protein S40288_09322 [Stachybotrys chartarum IBT 40288]